MVGRVERDVADAFGGRSTVRYLVRHGARINGWANGGVWPIHSAAIGGHTEIVRFFMNHGIDVDAPGANGTPLHYACRNGHYELAVFLVEHGADVNRSVFDAPTPLHVASASGQTEIARLLIAHGAKIDAEDSRRRTPFDLAVLNRHDDTAAFLESEAHSHHRAGGL